MRRLATPLGLALVMVLGLSAAVPRTTEAIQVFVMGEELRATDPAPDGEQRLRMLNGKQVFVVEGDFPTDAPVLRIEGCCGRSARVIVEDGDSVDQLIFTDAKISPLPGADLTSPFTFFFATSEGDLTAIEENIQPGYEYATAADGSFFRPPEVDLFGDGPLGDAIRVTGLANGLEVGGPPSLEHAVEGLDTASFFTRGARRAFRPLRCAEQETETCEPRLAADVQLTFTDPSDVLILVGSINVLGANTPGAAGQQPIDAILDGLPPRTSGNNPTRPGSVLVFPKFVRGTVHVGKMSSRRPGAVPEAILEPRSAFEISVVCPEGSTCSEGHEVKLLARWVCPGSQDPRAKFICKETDFELFTTVKGTLWFNPDSVGSMALPAGHPPIPQPQCQAGYLIVWVVSPDDGAGPKAIKFDGLVGNAVLRDGSGTASAHRAVAIQAVSGLATGDLTDVSGDGRLQFDGVTEYKMLTGQVRGSLRYERTINPPGTNLGTIDTFLTLLTLDVLSNRPNLPTFVDLHFFNENEVLLSASHEFICWSTVHLRDIDTNLDQFFGVKGLFESTEAEKRRIFGVADADGPVTLLGLVTTIERRPNGTSIREYSYEVFNDGRLVPTIFTPH